MREGRTPAGVLRELSANVDDYHAVVYAQPSTDRRVRLEDEQSVNFVIQALGPEAARRTVAGGGRGVGPTHSFVRFVSFRSFVSFPRGGLYRPVNGGGYGMKHVSIPVGRVKVGYKLSRRWVDRWLVVVLSGTSPALRWRSRTPTNCRLTRSGSSR